MSTGDLRDNLNSVLFRPPPLERRVMSYWALTKGSNRCFTSGIGPKRGTYRPLVDLSGKGLLFKWVAKLEQKLRILLVKEIFETILPPPPRNILIYKWDNDKGSKRESDLPESQQERM